MLLCDFVTNHSRRKPSEVFARQGSRQITLEEAAERIDRFAGALIGEGAVVGDRIGYLSKNDIDMAIMFLAVGRVGVVAVPLNYRLSAAELSAIVSDAKIKLFFAHSAFLSVADAFRSEQPKVARWIATDTQGRSGWTDLESWFDSHPPLSSGHPRPDVSDVACQMYTSGTTGRAKGVMITHANYHASVSQVVSCLEHRPSLGEATLLAMPLFHAGGMQVLTLAAYLGLTLVIHADFDSRIVAESLVENRIAIALFAPTMISFLLNEIGDVAERDWSALKTIMYGASPIDKPLLLRAMEVFGCDFYQSYGLTETTATVTMLDASAHARGLRDKASERQLASAGLPVFGTELRVTDRNGVPVSSGMSGEVRVRGAQIMLGYWKMPDETAEVLADGWFRTGDIGRIDEHGYLFIEDRLKDVIVSGGENISSKEIESVLIEHPAISDVAVVGIPDSRFGEAALGCIVLAAGASTPSLDDLVSFCRQKLGGYKIPRRFVFVPDLPRNATGKVLKRELRSKFRGTQDNLK